MLTSGQHGGPEAAPDDTAGGEWVTQYGHMTNEVGWIPEPRGFYYATSQRRVWLGPAQPISHFPPGSK